MYIKNIVCLYDVFEFWNDRMEIENIYTRNYTFFFVLQENWFNKSILIYLGVFLQPSAYINDNLLSIICMHTIQMLLYFLTTVIVLCWFLTWFNIKSRLNGIKIRITGETYF